jgi:hypothetical protein
MVPFVFSIFYSLDIFEIKEEEEKKMMSGFFFVVINYIISDNSHCLSNSMMFHLFEQITGKSINKLSSLD